MRLPPERLKGCFPKTRPRWPTAGDLRRSLTVRVFSLPRPGASDTGAGSSWLGVAPQEVQGKVAVVVQADASHLTEPAVMPASMNRCNRRKPITIGTLTVSQAAMIWFQYTLFWVAYPRRPTARVRLVSSVITDAKRTSPHAVMKA